MLYIVNVYVLFTIKKTRKLTFINLFSYICIIKQGFSELHTTLILRTKTLKKIEKELAPTWCRGIFLHVIQTPA